MKQLVAVEFFDELQHALLLQPILQVFANREGKQIGAVE
jgi:hypothetical protein